MSMNSGKRRVRAGSVDRRARRTRVALAEALMALGPEVGIDRLDVQKLVTAAGVGRSTFYKHFADKDDFFITSFAGMVAMFDAHAQKRAGYDIMLPAREVYQHVEGARAFALSLASSGQFALRTHSARIACALSPRRICAGAILHCRSRSDRRPPWSWPAPSRA